MSSAAETPSNKKLKDYEFTPIGYVKEKLGEMDSANGNGLKRPLEQTNEPATDKRRNRNHNASDETFNSTRLFQDTTFDETLPENLAHQDLPSSKKNLTSDLLSKAYDNTENLTSNPLKETEISLRKLQTENYNLRIKCTSLLKFLNNVSSDGEVAKNLEILEELHDLKHRHQQLNHEYNAFKVAIEKAEKSDVTNNSDELNKERELKTELQKRLNLSEEQLQKSNKTHLQLKETIKSLENKVFSIRAETKEKEEQASLKNSLLESKINDLSTSLQRREGECSDMKEKIEWLTSQLQEFDHQSDSVLELQKKMDLKNEAIRNLEEQLQKNEHKRQSLDREISLLRSELVSFKKTHEDVIASKNSQINQLTERATSTDSELIKKMDDILAEKVKLMDINKKLEISAFENKNSLEKLQSQVKYYEEELTRLKETHLSQINALKSNMRLNSTDSFNILQKDLSELKRENDVLKAEKISLSRRLENQIKKSPSKKAVDAELGKKDKELLILRSTIKDLEEELRQTELSFSDYRSQTKKEIDLLREQLLSVPSDSLLERKKLENEISMLRLELDSVRDTKEKEVSMWNQRYDTLKRANEELLKEGSGQSEHWKNTLLERDRELQQLQSRYQLTQAENITTAQELTKSKKEREDLKSELRKVQSRLEFITKEFIQLKENSKLQGSQYVNDELKEKWLAKYQSMKKRLMDELKILQEENLELQRNIIRRSKNPATNTESSANKSSLQDQVDYYKLKCKNEQKENKDLRVMNDYLNKVLRASSQHVKLDILRLENEIPMENSFAGYPFTQQPSSRYPPKFKTVALLVLSCIRMKQTIERRRWNKQRLDYLQRKIILSQDKITW